MFINTLELAIYGAVVCTFIAVGIIAVAGMLMSIQNAGEED